jgi:hypothetical protein
LVPRGAGREITAADRVRRPRVFDQASERVRTLGCVRAAWQRAALAAWHCGWLACRWGTSYARSGEALTAMETDPEAAHVTRASWVPLHEALWRQQRTFAVMFEKRARSPRLTSRRGRQFAHCTCCAFDLRRSEHRLTKTGAPQSAVWPASTCSSRSSRSSWRGKNDGTTDPRPAARAHVRSAPRCARECQLSPSPTNRPGQDPARRRQGGTGG